MSGCSDGVDSGVHPNGGAGGTDGLPSTTGDDGGDGGNEPDPNHEGWDGCNFGEANWNHVGWSIPCEVVNPNGTVSQRIYTPISWDPPPPGTLPQPGIILGDVQGEFGETCCGGVSTPEDAAASCTAACVTKVCGAASAQHVEWTLAFGQDVTSCIDYGLGSNCGFDSAGCFNAGLTGTSYVQTVSPTTADGDFWQYELQIVCDAESPMAPFQDGKWTWVDLPENDPDDDLYPFCGEAPAHSSPTTAPTDFASTSTPGATSANVSWVYLGQPGDETTVDVTVDVDYAVVPCNDGDCLALAGLEATMPDTQILGYQVSDIRLVVEQVSARPPIRRGGFSFGAGQMRAMLNYRADGKNHAASSYNTVTATGAFSGDAFAFRNLAFNFGNAVVSADLRLDVSSQLTERPPEATIAVLDAPSDCSLPVTFESRSVDPDGLPIQKNMWMSPSAVDVGTGQYFELELAAGEQTVVGLLSQDAAGRTDSAGLHYQRRCQ